jgi:hypothetical protein
MTRAWFGILWVSFEFRCFVFRHALGKVNFETFNVGYPLRYWQYLHYFFSQSDNIVSAAMAFIFWFRKANLMFFLTVHHSIELFHLPTLMHNSLFIKNVYSYTTILDIFRALTCPSSGGPIVFSQHLVTSLSVNGCTVHRLRAELSTGVLQNNCEVSNQKIYSVT